MLLENLNLSYLQTRDSPGPLNMPTPTPAPDRAGPVACLRDRKNQVWGSGGVWKSILIVNCHERVAQKLRRIIQLHIGLETFTFHFPKNQKNIISMIFGTSGHIDESQNQLF